MKTSSKVYEKRWREDLQAKAARKLLEMLSLDMWPSWTQTDIDEVQKDRPIRIKLFDFNG